MSILKKIRSRFFPPPEEKRQRKILRQFRRQLQPPSRFHRPHLWLLRLLLHRRCLAVTRAAERNARTVLLLARLRPLKLTGKKTRSGCAWLALKKNLRKFRRRCRLARQRLKVRLVRWVWVQRLSGCLWLFLKCLPLL
ncbi:MAG TPA: hypothetical protein VIK35_12240, partial [Verrucomicrobiae bacterium]